MASLKQVPIHFMHIVKTGPKLHLTKTEGIASKRNNYLMIHYLIVYLLMERFMSLECPIIMFDTLVHHLE